MLESVLFHFFFLVFFVVSLTWWIRTKKKLESFQQVLTPALLNPYFQLPQDRSLLVRTFQFLEEELRAKWNRDVNIQFSFENLNAQFPNSLTQDLCYLIFPSKSMHKKLFLFNDHSFSPQEMLDLIHKEKNKTKVRLFFNAEKKIWCLEFIHD